MRFLAILIGFLLCIGSVQAQNIQYGVALDSNMMLIGDQQHLRFQVLSDQAMDIDFPNLKDSIHPNIEIIEGPVLDTTQQSDNKILYQATYLITAFDTGIYVIPQMPIMFKSGDYNNLVRTDSVTFGVTTVQVEKDKIFDIVKPLDMPITLAEILPYILWGIGILAIIALVIWIFIRYKKHEPLLHASPKPSIPPYITAMKAFKELHEQKLWQEGRVKEYYTSLTDIVRLYMDHELNIAAIEQTSDEIMRDLNRCKYITEQDKQSLKELLQTADFVKFAKSIPLPDENAKNYDAAYNFVQNINQRIEAERQAANQKEAPKTTN